MRPEIAPVLDVERPVRVTPRTGAALVVWHPRVVGDSLVGDVGYPATRTAFALRDIRQFEELGFSRVRTGVALLAGLSLSLLILFMHSLLTEGTG